MISGYSLMSVAGWAYPPEIMTNLVNQIGTTFSFRKTNLTSVYHLVDLDQELDFKNRPSCYAHRINGALHTLTKDVIGIGWSMGGIALLETACWNANAFSALVLISATPRFIFDNDFVFGKKDLEIKNLARGILTDDEATYEKFFSKTQNSLLGNQATIDNSVKYVTGLDQRKLLHGLAYLEHIDVRRHLPNIHVPVLLIHGKNDPIVSWEASEFLSQKLPQNKTLVIEDAGHDVFITHQTQVLKEIKEFIGAL